MIVKHTLLVAALVLVAGPAFAEHHEGEKSGKMKEMREQMKAQIKAEIDTDGDGSVSKAEFMAVQEKRFSDMDLDGDGKISDEEHRASIGKWREKRDDMQKKIKEMQSDSESKPAEEAAQ